MYDMYSMYVGMYVRTGMSRAVFTPVCTYGHCLCIVGFQQNYHFGKEVAVPQSKQMIPEDWVHRVIAVQIATI